MSNSIGCFYSFEKCVIVTANLRKKKVYLSGESFSHISIGEIAVKLNEIHYDDIIWINKHQSLKDSVDAKLNELDFTNENDVNEMIDIYKSLEKENKLVFESEINTSKSHDLKALYLSLKGLNYYKYSTGYEWLREI